MKRTATLAILVLSVVLSACGGMRAASPEAWPLAPSEEWARADMVAGAPAMEAPAGEWGNSPAPAPANAERMVIQNASLVIVVDDPAATAEAISAMAEAMGGFVVSVNIYRTTYGPAALETTQGSVTVRVPSDRLTEALDLIEADANEVRQRNVSGQDVTAEFTDLSSRLRNLEAAEQQLREILASATRTEDVMLVFNQLTQVRGEIEVVRGQMRYYEESARLSSVSVELIPDAAAQPIQIGRWQPGVTLREAVEDLVRGLQALVDLSIRLAVCGLPALVILGLPAWIVIRALIRRRRAARAAE